MSTFDDVYGVLAGGFRKKAGGTHGHEVRPIADYTDGVVHLRPRSDPPFTKTDVLSGYIPKSNSFIMWDFEDGMLDDWIPFQSPYPDVTNEEAYSGNKSVEFRLPEGKAFENQLLGLPFTDTEELVFSSWVYFHVDGSEWDSSFEIRIMNLESIDPLIVYTIGWVGVHITDASNGQFTVVTKHLYLGGPSYIWIPEYLCDFNMDGWHQIMLTTDGTAKTMNIYLDGDQVAWDVPYQEDYVPNSIGILGNVYSSATRIYVDDVIANVTVERIAGYSKQGASTMFTENKDYVQSPPGILEVSVLDNFWDEDVTLNFNYYPSIKTDSTVRQVGDVTYNLPEYVTLPEIISCSLTIPAFTRKGKLFPVYDQSGDQVINLGYLDSMTASGSGHGTVRVDSVIGLGAKVFHAFKDTDALDVYYKMEQARAKGPRICPYCKGQGRDPDDNNKMCPACEGKRFFRTDHYIIDSMLEDFLKSQGVLYGGATKQEMIAMAYIVNNFINPTPEEIINFFARVYDIPPDLVWLYTSYNKQNAVGLITIPMHCGPNALFDLKDPFSYLQWMAETIRPAGVTYIASVREGNENFKSKLTTTLSNNYTTDQQCWARANEF